MTTNTLMTMNPRRPPAQAPRERLDSFAETPTGLLTLSPELLDALRQVAPKVRRRVLPYGLLLAAAFGIGVASGQQVLLNRHAGVRISVPAPPIATAGPRTATADSADRGPSARPVDSATTSAAGVATTALPAAATTVSGDDPARAEKSKTTRTRHAKTPR